MGRAARPARPRRRPAPRGRGRPGGGPKELLGRVAFSSFHDLVTVSWRLSSTRATCVQAASSAASSPSGGGATPVEIKARAAAGFAR